MTSRSLSTRIVGAEARSVGFQTVVASVDEANGPSVHVLEKLGFRQTATYQGSFGAVRLLQLDFPDSGHVEHVG